MSEALLPSDAGPATRAYAAMWDSFGRYGSFIGTIKHIGITIIPDDWVPWFIWDYGLEDVVPYVRDYRRVLAEGPEWQRTRGTDRGIEIGIGWVESAGVVDAPDGRHNWWEFQVGFTVPPSDLAQIQQLAGIIKLSSAAEDELFRMFSPGRDVRPVRMDQHRYDDGLMDDYSGEVLWPDGPQISFGWAGDIEADFGSDVVGADKIIVSTEIDRLDGYRMDIDLFEGRAPALTEHAVDIEQNMEAAAFARDVWPSRWPRSWAEAVHPTATSSPWETT
jgi:hypothetical protein